MKKKSTHAIMVFNLEVTKKNYGSLFEEYSFGFGLHYDQKTGKSTGRDPELLEFVHELLRDFGTEAFDTESLPEDVGFHAVFIERNAESEGPDFQLIIERALARGFYLSDETNAGELFIPQK